MQAYGKIVGPDFEYYIQTLSVTFGRGWDKGVFERAIAPNLCELRHVDCFWGPTVTRVGTSSLQQAKWMSICLASKGYVAQILLLVHLHRRGTRTLIRSPHNCHSYTRSVKVEERHATINHDFNKNVFQIACVAPHTCVSVNGLETQRGGDPIPLKTRY